MKNDEDTWTKFIKDNTQVALTVWDSIVDLAAFCAKQQARIWLGDYFREEQNKRRASASDETK